MVPDAGPISDRISRQPRPAARRARWCRHRWSL